jgi:hypothetical protein
MSTSPRVTDWIVSYNLSEPCEYTDAKNSHSIELRTECHVQSKSERINGFDIKVNRESKKREVLKKADEQAKRLTDIITFKREKRVTCHLTGLNKKIRTKPREVWKLIKTETVVWHNLKSIELDLTDKALAQKIAKEKDISHRLNHASIALGAEELRLFPTMFTEFFQVIEIEDNKKKVLKKKKKLPKYYLKYEALRNALSHRELDPKRAIAQVNCYYRNRNKFEFTPTNEFNYNSEKNMRQLKSEANKLKKHAMSYLEKNINL